MGKRLFVLFIFLFSLCPALFSEPPRQDKRIEEEKRKDLKQSQEPLAEETKKELTATQEVGFDYFRSLISKEIALQADACKSLAVLLNIDQEFQDLPSQINALKQKNIIPKKLTSSFNPQEPLRKGVAAYMFCKALDIKGGVVLRIFGISQRYALKELVFQEIMRPGYERDVVSGKELVLMVTEAANYLISKQDKTTKQ
ncbi:MAG: hypothetical protein JW734_07205 [Candidatus Omnitrophica bacterium]|nr:hypothetical protein [Candidatus Omnitrophota bacterium]